MIHQKRKKFLVGTLDSLSIVKKFTLEIVEFNIIQFKAQGFDLTKLAKSTQVKFSMEALAVPLFLNPNYSETSKLVLLSAAKRRGCCCAGVRVSLSPQKTGGWSKTSCKVLTRFSR